MAKDQQSRRRKRRVVESAYAGDVKPPGFFRLFVSARVIRGIFIVMALALIGGLIAGALSAGAFGGSGQKPDPTFVVPPDDDDPAAQATATPEPKHYDEAPPFSIDPEKTYHATVKTASGDFTIELRAVEAPNTVNNFVFLARQGFYNGLAFFEVDPEFSAQTGDPRCTSAEDRAQNCSGGPGYEWVQESPGAFSRGDVGLVNGSQFVIALPESDQLLAQFEEFTPFGRVVSGLEVVEQLEIGTTITEITIEEE